MKLGEMLVRDGRVTPVQLHQAIAHQGRSGGRLGSILVELGFLDAETLTVYLGLELGMPIATGATLERCKRSAVRLLTPHQAARYRCIPIVIQGQTLILAIEDPLDMLTLDALHNMTGYRILPRVAPEIRIHYYLERFYGVPRPLRFVALGDSPRGNPAIGSHTGGLPGPPLPGLPPRRTQPVVPPTPRPSMRRTTSQPPPMERPVTRPPPVPAAAHAPAAHAAPAASAAPPMRAPIKKEQEALEIDAIDLVIELDADDAYDADVASHVAGHDGHGHPVRPQTARVPLPRVPLPPAHADPPPLPPAIPRDTQPEIVVPPGVRENRERARTSAEGPDGSATYPSPYPATALDVALAIMASTDQRGAVADAMLGYAAGVFEVAALCLVRDHMALGWKGFGPRIDDDRIEALLIPLEMPSIYQLAARGRELFRGHAFPAALHDHVFKVLRCHAPLYSVVAPVSIGPRVVNLLYGHKGDGGDINDEETAGLRQLTAAAGEAYVRLISASKAQRKSA
jgi:Type II secretion system (T2SS), protein E, N-terminal domain